MRAVFALLRRVVFWSHLSLGVVAGLVILLMSVTGVLLGFERQVIAFVDGTPAVVAAGAPRLPLDSLLVARGIAVTEVARVLVKADPTAPVELRFRERGRDPLLLDPYSAAVVPPVVGGSARAAMASLRRWHRWVGAEGGEWRARFKAVTGASNLAFLLIVLSGLVLWVPRRWNVAALRQVTWFRRGLGPKARDFNWHNTIGFWSALPLAAIVAAGVFISYRWPGQWLDRALGSPEERAAAVAALRGEDAPARPAVRETNAGATAAAAPHEGEPAADEPAAASLEAYVASAIARHPDWQTLTLTVPEPGEARASIAVAEGNTYRPDLRTTLQLDVATARVADVQDYASLSPSRKIRAWVRFGHTGEVFGLAGQIVATLVSAGAAVLVWTGLALSWRRLGAWRRRRLSAAPAAG